MGCCCASRCCEDPGSSVMVLEGDQPSFPNDYSSSPLPGHLKLATRSSSSASRVHNFTDFSVSDPARLNLIFSQHTFQLMADGLVEWRQQQSSGLLLSHHRHESNKNEMFPAEAVSCLAGFLSDATHAMNARKVRRMQLTLYSRLFCKVPGLRRAILKHGDVETTSRRLGNHLSWLILALSQIHDHSLLMQQFRILGRIHDSYGVFTDHFEALLHALHTTLLEFFPRLYTIRVKLCLEKVFISAARVMAEEMNSDPSNFDEDAALAEKLAGGGMSSFSTTTTTTTLSTIESNQPMMNGHLSGNDDHHSSSALLFAQRLQAVNEMDFLKSLPLCLAHKYGRQYLKHYFVQINDAKMIEFIEMFESYKSIHASHHRQRFDLVLQIFERFFASDSPQPLWDCENVAQKHVDKLKSDLERFIKLINKESEQEEADLRHVNASAKGTPTLPSVKEHPLLDSQSEPMVRSKPPLSRPHIIHTEDKPVMPRLIDSMTQSSVSTVTTAGGGSSTPETSSLTTTMTGMSSNTFTESFKSRSMIPSISVDTTTKSVEYTATTTSRMTSSSTTTTTTTSTSTTTRMTSDEMTFIREDYDHHKDPTMQPKMEMATSRSVQSTPIDSMGDSTDAFGKIESKLVGSSGGRSVSTTDTLTQNRTPLPRGAMSLSTNPSMESLFAIAADGTALKAKKSASSSSALTSSSGSSFLGSSSLLGGLSASLSPVGQTGPLSAATPTPKQSGGVTKLALEPKHSASIADLLHKPLGVPSEGMKGSDPHSSSTISIQISQQSGMDDVIQFRCHSVDKLYKDVVHEIKDVAWVPFKKSMYGVRQMIRIKGHGQPQTSQSMDSIDHMMAKELTDYEKLEWWQSQKSYEERNEDDEYEDGIRERKERDRDDDDNPEDSPDFDSKHDEDRDTDHLIVLSPAQKSPATQEIDPSSPTIPGSLIVSTPTKQSRVYSATEPIQYSDGGKDPSMTPAASESPLISPAEDDRIRSMKTRAMTASTMIGDSSPDVSEIVVHRNVSVASDTTSTTIGRGPSWRGTGFRSIAESETPDDRDDYDELTTTTVTTEHTDHSEMAHSRPRLPSAPAIVLKKHSSEHSDQPPITVDDEPTAITPYPPAKSDITGNLHSHAVSAIHLSGSLQRKKVPAYGIAASMSGEDNDDDDAEDEEIDYEAMDMLDLIRLGK